MARACVILSDAHGVALAHLHQLGARNMAVGLLARWVGGSDPTQSVYQVVLQKSF